MKKILILSNSSQGLYEFRRELLEDLGQDYEMHISLPEADGDKYISYIRNLGCRVYSIPFQRRGTNPFKDLKLCGSYIRLIRKVKPAVMFTYTIKPNIYGGIAGKATGTPVIMNITGLGSALQREDLMSRVLTLMYGLASRGAAKVFFQNRSNMEYCLSKGIGRNNPELLPGSGVNLNHFTYQPQVFDGVFKALSVMRIMKEKGIEEYLELVEKFGDKKHQFFIAGDYEEEERARYSGRIEALVKKGKLTYLGYVEDMREKYRECNVLIHPSYHEGLSNVCLEGAATGRPIITTDVPGCRETVSTVTNQESGLLVKAGSASDLQRVFGQLLKLTNSELEQMGLNGRLHVEKYFSRQVVIDKYREALKELENKSRKIK